MWWTLVNMLALGDHDMVEPRLPHSLEAHRSAFEEACRVGRCIPQLHVDGEMDGLLVRIRAGRKDNNV